MGDLPRNIYIHPHQNDYESYLRGVIDDLRANRQQMAPSFAFIDPYGFKISMDLLNSLLAFRTSELLINFMYRYVDMAIRLPEQSDNMDGLFGTHDWQRLKGIDDHQIRMTETIGLFTRQLSADYVTTMNMLGRNRAVKYVLIHATNHRKGRELMKEALWALTPDGTFSAQESHSPDQPVLLVPEPDLQPLKDAVLREFAGQTVQMDQLYAWLEHRIYLKKHLHQVLRGMRKEGTARFSDYQGRFAFDKNPSVSVGVVVS